MSSERLPVVATFGLEDDILVWQRNATSDEVLTQYLGCRRREWRGMAQTEDRGKPGWGYVVKPHLSSGCADCTTAFMHEGYCPDRQSAASFLSSKPAQPLHFAFLHCVTVHLPDQFLENSSLTTRVPPHLACATTHFEALSEVCSRDG